MNPPTNSPNRRFRHKLKNNTLAFSRFLKRSSSSIIVTNPHKIKNSNNAWQHKQQYLHQQGAIASMTSTAPASTAVRRRDHNKHKQQQPDRPHSSSTMHSLSSSSLSSSSYSPCLEEEGKKEHKKESIFCENANFNRVQKCNASAGTKTPKTDSVAITIDSVATASMSSKNSNSNANKNNTSNFILSDLLIQTNDSSNNTKNTVSSTTSATTSSGPHHHHVIDIGMRNRLKALECQQRLYGEAHPDVLFSLHNLGYTLRQKGEYAQALLIFQEEKDRRQRRQQQQQREFSAVYVSNAYGYDDDDPSSAHKKITIAATGGSNNAVTASAPVPQEITIDSRSC